MLGEEGKASRAIEAAAPPGRYRVPRFDVYVALPRNQTDGRRAGCDGSYDEAAAWNDWRMLGRFAALSGASHSRVWPLDAGECPTLRSPNRLSDCSATAEPRAVRRRNSLCYTELVLSRCSFLCCAAGAGHPIHFRSEGFGHTGENTHTTGCAAAAVATAHTRRHSA